MSLFAEYFVEILVSLLLVAFTAWASVVWNTGNKALELLADVKNRISELAVETRHITERFAAHEHKPWHARAGEDLSSLKARVDALERESNNGGR